MKINWKDPAKALTKLYPREAGEDEDEPAEPGSFFNFFEIEADPYDVRTAPSSSDCWFMLTCFLFQVGLAIATEVFADAIDHFLGHGLGDDVDSDIDSDEDDDDDDAEIDLEKPKAKKQKV